MISLAVWLSFRFYALTHSLTLLHSIPSPSQALLERAETDFTVEDRSSQLRTTPGASAAAEELDCLLYLLRPRSD